jgi:hypothetical protein
MPTPTEFTDFQFGQDTSAERSGDSLQFTSDNKTPEAMAAEVSSSENAFSELQNFLMNNLETPGSRVCPSADKPWTPSHPQGPGPGDGKTGI